MTEQTRLRPMQSPISTSAASVGARDRFRFNLARVMAEQGMTQAALAREMRVSRVAVHAWIWGTCFPETARLLQLAKVLDVPVGALLEGEAGPAAKGTADDELLLLNAFRKLPDTARLSLLADVYKLAAQSLGAKEAAAG